MQGGFHNGLYQFPLGVPAARAVRSVLGQADCSSLSKPMTPEEHGGSRYTELASD